MWNFNDYFEYCISWTIISIHVTDSDLGENQLEVLSQLDDNGLMDCFDESEGSFIQNQSNECILDESTGCFVPSIHTEEIENNKDISGVKYILSDITGNFEVIRNDCEEEMNNTNNQNRRWKKAAPEMWKKINK